MLELPSGWRQLPLAEIVHAESPIVYGIVQAGPEYPDGVPYIKSSDVGGAIDPDGLSRTAPEIAAKYQRSFVKPGDIVFSLRGNIGELSIVPDSLPSANLTQGTARISVNGIASNEFVAYTLTSPALQRRIATVGKGSTFREISLEELRKLDVWLPPLPEQRKIAEILRTWDEAIDACERLIERKQKRLASARQHIFGRDGLPPDKWPSAKLASLVERIQRQSDGEEHPVMTISGKLGFRRQDEKFARFMAGESVSRYLLLKRGEFAYNKGNSKTFPQGCIYRLEQDTALVPFVYFAFALSDDLGSDFYGHLFASGFLNRQLGRLINSGVRNDGLLNIYADDFFGCEVPVPPQSEQERIGQLFNAFDEELTALGKQLEHLKQQKRGLMQKLLTGEWRVDV